MPVEKWLAEALKKLDSAGIGSARLDCLILLEDCLQKDKSYLLAHPELVIPTSRLKKINGQLLRRKNHEPLAYIRGFTEFYGRKFNVNKRVLEPRPESEAIIDLLKGLSLPKGAKIADVGAGSGCLGITAALELHNHNVDLYDIDADALAVAKNNMAMHELRLKASKKDLLRNCHTKYAVIIANLPYVPDSWQINQAAAMEPRIAIFGGPDGLDVYRRLFKQLDNFSWRPKYVLTECLPPQHKTLADIAGSSGFRHVAQQDFIQVFGTS